MSALEIFRHQSHDLRVIIDDAGNPWFVATDVASALGYRMASDMTRRLDPDEKGTHSLRTPGGEQQVTVVSEPGLYTAVLGSQVNGAREFKRWVTHEVLPQIRHTGSYAPAPLPAFDPLSIDGARMLGQALTTALAALDAAQPKAEAYDHLMDASGLYSMEAAAKALGFGRNVLYRTLRRLGVLQGNNLPYQRYVHHFEIKLGTYRNRDGDLVPTTTTYVRPSGVEFLRQKIAQADQAVVAAGVIR